MHVPHLLFRSAARTPHAPLWLDGDRRIAYREGAVRVARLAHALLEVAGGQRRHVAILSANRFEALEAWLACGAAGLAAVPLNPRLHVDEYAFMLNDAEACAVISSPDFANVVEPLRRRLPAVTAWIEIGAGYESLLASRPDAPPEIDIEPDDVAWLFYTSGTTGRPKGAMETHRNLLTMTQQFLLGLIPDAAPGDVMLHAAPTSHGTCSCMLPHLAVGAANAFPPPGAFDADTILSTIEQQRVTTTFLAPTMIQILVRSGRVPAHDTSSLKSIIYGGGPMHVETLHAALATFGPVLVQIYGQGEAPMTCTALPKAEHDRADPERAARLMSAGRELPAVRVRIVDDADRPLPNGETGEIVVRSDLVMRGYWRRPDETAEALRGGWLHTGDVGHLDDAGYLFVTDRKKDLIISGGSNIYPREVEEVLLRHPAVAECAVLGIPDERWGESVLAVVVRELGSDVTSTELIAHCQTGLASYKKPRRVEFADALPKNATGKVLRRELRARWWAERERQI